jgi:hypothetical protein
VEEAHELTALIRRADFAGVYTWLGAADEAEVRAARAWYVKGRRETDRLYSWKGTYREQLSADVRSNVEWIRAVLAVGLAGPASAARWVPWTSLWDHHSTEHFEFVVDVARARGEQWCREFVPPAAAVRMGERDLQLYSLTLFRLVAPLIRAYAVPVPAGASFAVGWAHQYGGWPASNGVPRPADDPLLPDVFHHLLASGFVVKLRCAAEAATDLVYGGRLDRDRLVAQCIEMLTSLQRVSTQRVIAKILAELAVTRDELAGGLPLLQNLIATCHGSVGAVLLPFALDAVSREDELVELCMTVAGRTERKQQKDVIAALSTGLAARLGTAAAIAGLEVIRDSAADDPQLSALVERTLERLGAPVEGAAAPTPVASGLWQLEPAGEPFVSPRVVLVDDRADADRTYEWAARNGPRRLQRPDVDDHIPAELHLGELVRRADPDGGDSVREWLALLPWTDRVRQDPVLEGIYDAHLEPSAEAYVARVQDAGPVALDVRTKQMAPLSTVWFWPHTFRYLLARESMVRLGRTPCLLSTPTRGDATLDFDDLVARIKLAQGGSGFGPLDLLQALLRLRTPQPERADELAGLRLALDPLIDVPTCRCSVTDGVAAVREWVRAGGLPALTAQPAPYGYGLRATRTCHPPIAPATFGTLPPEAYQPGHSDPFAQPVVAPRWWELDTDGPSHERPFYTHHELAPGSLSYLGLLDQMAADRRDHREAAARTALAMIGEQRFDPAAFAAWTLERIGARDLPIARVTSVWDLMAGAGGLRLLWPAVLTITAQTVATHPLPTGTHNLLAWLTRYVADVPDAEIPPKIASFARSHGSTKAHYEARALLNATRPAIPA